MSTLHSVNACMLVAHWESCICRYILFVYSCVPFDLRDGKCSLSLFIFAFCCWMWPLFLLHPFPFSLLHFSDYFSAVPFFSVSSHSLKTCHFVVSLYLYPLFFFPPSPPPPFLIPLAGCKMDSPQSESSGEEQKAEENRAQGELQKGRRHSTVLKPLSTFPLLYF